MNSRTYQQTGTTRFPSRAEVVERALHELGAVALAAEVTDAPRCGAAPRRRRPRGSRRSAIDLAVELPARSGIDPRRFERSRPWRRSTRSRLDRNPCARLSTCLRSDCSARRAVSRLASTTSAPIAPATSSTTTTCSRTSTGPAARPRRSPASRSSGLGSPAITLTGLELADLRLLDVELVECELSGAVLTGARWERVVAAPLPDVGARGGRARRPSTCGSQDCKADQAWLRASVLDRCELVDTDLRGADLYGARVTRSAFRRCDLTEVDVSASQLRAGVAPRLHHRPPQGRRVAAGPARSAATSSCRWRCRSWPPAASPSTTTRPISSTATD